MAKPAQIRGPLTPALLRAIPPSTRAERSERGADVAELVDALDLGSSAERRGGSSPFIRTKYVFSDKSRVA